MQVICFRCRSQVTCDTHDQGQEFLGDHVHKKADEVIEILHDFRDHIASELTRILAESPSADLSALQGQHLLLGEIIRNVQDKCKCK